MLHEISVARAEGTYALTLGRLAQLDVLVLDDFLIAPLKDQERRNLAEILEDRYGKVSSIVTSQVPTKNWHETLADPTMADAICDRLLHHAHVAIRGPSMRQKKGMLETISQPPDLKLVASLRSGMTPSLRDDSCPGPPECLPRSRRNRRPDQPEYAAGPRP